MARVRMMDRLRRSHRETLAKGRTLASPDGLSILSYISMVLWEVPGSEDSLDDLTVDFFEVLLQGSESSVLPDGEDSWDTCFFCGIGSDGCVSGSVLFDGRGFATVCAGGRVLRALLARAREGLSSSPSDAKDLNLDWEA